MASVTDRVLEKIDREELVDLALKLGNIDSPPGQERGMAQAVEAWLKQEGFKTKVLSLLESRPNVIGALKGSGGGLSLLFNSHMDTVVSRDAVLSRRDSEDPIYHQAWREGDRLFGNGIVNDKGPMACFLIAARAIKQAGIALKGDIILTAVSGEVAWEPIDEFQPPKCPGTEIGTRFIATHGGIADYALVAEATNFQSAWVEAGKLYVKITVFGEPRLYTPYLKGSYSPEKNPNAIVRMSRLINEIEAWAAVYEREHTYVCPGGTLIPKVAIGAIRGGEPFALDGTSEVCSIYIDIRTAPGQNFLDIKAELENKVRSLELDGEVDIFASEPGYEANATGIGPLVEAVDNAHKAIFGKKPEPAIGPVCSMWRDNNIFNEVGIPSLTYGPAAGTGGRNYSILIDDLYKAAEIYAMVALDICSRERRPRGRGK
ncbi:MAG: M20/M25/M40 family metallo-hydrolase [Chloroflexi bacterium]|nr:M20/M25/M40 family metallo-hydrolase [Chloroflexota bacterium]